MSGEVRDQRLRADFEAMVALKAASTILDFEHVGEPPDSRAQETARSRGIDLADLRARRAEPEDFHQFDYVIAMDEDNLMRLRDKAPPEHHSKLRLFLEYSSGSEREVPDPYYGGAAGFERVLDLVEEASRGLLETLSRQ